MGLNLFFSRLSLYLTQRLLESLAYLHIPVPVAFFQFLKHIKLLLSQGLYP